jgi:hypothetical protein
MDIPSYQYQPLQHSDSIRVLILHPSSNESDPIACTIRQVQLSDNSLTYDAVSYTWGDSTQTYPIYFKNEREKLIVGKNCHSALRRLRLPNKDRTVWIDAICIDQENLTERSSQVRLMNEVYSRAARVMVILGDQVPECRLLQKRSEWFIKMFGGDLSTVSALPNSRGLDLLNIVPSSKSVIDQLEKLFEEPWFKRTWVLQEVYKKRRITVIYGSASLPITVLKWICYGDSGIKSTRGALPRPLTFLWTSQVEYSTPQFNLWNRLYKSRECLASNPRDKIFALKSLLGARQSEIDHLIDYTQSVEECFKRVAEFLLLVLGIRIITATRHPHNLDMASWIPDWSQNLPLQYPAFHFESDKARALGNIALRATFEDHERAQRSCSIHDLPTARELHAVGCQYAQIVKSSQVFHFLNADDTERQMCNLYNDFENLRQCLEAKTKRSLATSFSLGRFGRKIYHRKRKSGVE